MKISLKVLFWLLITASGSLVFAESDGDKANSKYKKSKIKNRARLQTKRGTDSIGDKQYIYAGDDEINDALKNQKGTNEFSLGSTSLKKGTHLREVNILVEGRGKKEIEVDSKGKDPATVNIGHVEVGKGSSVRKVKSIIEMEVQVESK